MGQFSYIGSGAPAVIFPGVVPGSTYLDQSNDTEYVWDGNSNTWRAFGLVSPAVDGVTALGNSQGTATVLAPGKGLYNVTNVAAGTGVLLPPSVTGQETVVNNNQGTNALLVYPNGTETINLTGAGVAISVPINSALIFYCFTAGKMYTK